MIRSCRTVTDAANDMTFTPIGLWLLLRHETAAMPADSPATHKGWRISARAPIRLEAYLSISAMQAEHTRRRDLKRVMGDVLAGQRGRIARGTGAGQPPRD